MMSEIERKFKNPPAEFRSACFWSWNDSLEEGELERQLEEMKRGGQDLRFQLQLHGHRRARGPLGLLDEPDRGDSGRERPVIFQEVLSGVTTRAILLRRASSSAAERNRIVDFAYSLQSCAVLCVKDVSTSLSLKPRMSIA